MPTKIYLWYCAANVRFTARGEHQQAAFDSLPLEKRNRVPFAEFCVELRTPADADMPYMGLLKLRELRRAQAEPVSMHCDQCEMLSINGVACHETGCPNFNRRWDADSGAWIKQRKCFECGSTVDADDPCCSAEEPQS